MMTDQDIKRHMDFAKSLLKEKQTKEEAFASLVSAGILTKKGNFRKPYRHIGRLIKRK